MKKITSIILTFVIAFSLCSYANSPTQTNKKISEDNVQEINVAAINQFDAIAEENVDILYSEHKSLSTSKSTPASENSIEFVEAVVSKQADSGSVSIDVSNLPEASDFSAAGYTHKVLHIGANGDTKSIGVWNLSGVSKIVISYGSDHTVATIATDNVYITDDTGNIIGQAQLSQPGLFWSQGQRTVEVFIDTDYNGEIFITKDDPQNQIAIDVIVLIGDNITNNDTVKILSSGTCGDDLTWILNNEGTLTIIGTGKMTEYSYTSPAPWYDNRKNVREVVVRDGVTNIGAWSFYNCSELFRVVIGNSVETIGDCAFRHCEQLRSITMGENIRSIGDSAFDTCRSLTSVTIDNSVTSIGDSAFSACTSLTSIRIGSSVTSIGNYAFEYCEKLTSITVPDSVTSIGIYAFMYCSGLTSITIPENVASIGDETFYGCLRLESIIVNKNNEYYSNDEYGVLFNKDKTALIQYPIGNERISYVIPDCVTSISDSAFSNCSHLTSITIGEGVTSISNFTFRYCSKIEFIFVNKNNKYYSSDECGVLFDKNKTALIQHPRNNGRVSYVIPISVTSIGDYAFERCAKLTSITIPENVASIGDYSFSWCSSLTSIIIPDSITYIGANAFEYCFNLTKIYITDIAKWCSITFLSYISTRSSFNSGVNLYLNDELVTDLIIPNGVTSINNYAFHNCKSLISVTIPDSVTSIGDCAFYDCSSLTSVTIPDSVTSIGNSAFYNCNNLISITIPDSVTSIGDRAFYSCYSLTSITVDANNEYYSNDEYGVLFNKDKTTLIQYPIGNEKTTYVIPSSVTSIGISAFEDCSNLTSVTISNSVTNICDYAFWYCQGLTSVTIPESVVSIGWYAFYDCSNLKKVYYTGSEEKWNQIYIDLENDPLLNATIHFNTFVPEVPELSEGSGYVVNEAVDAIVAKASAKGGESLAQFMANIATDPECIRVVDADGNIQTSVTKLITGYKFQLLGPDGSVLKDYEIVILGDTDRNGRFSISDVSGVQSAVAAKPDKNTVEFLEANIDGNSRLSVTDASALQSFLANGTW